MPGISTTFPTFLRLTPPIQSRFLGVLPNPRANDIMITAKSLGGIWEYGAGGWEGSQSIEFENHHVWDETKLMNYSWASLWWSLNWIVVGTRHSLMISARSALVIRRELESRQGQLRLLALCFFDYFQNQNFTTLKVRQTVANERK